MIPGDTHVHRPVEDMELLLRAEELHVAPVITWWNNRNAWADVPLPADPLKKFDGQRFANILAGEDEREGGALLFFHLPRPLALAGSSREYPSQCRRRMRGCSPEVTSFSWPYSRSACRSS